MTSTRRTTRSTAAAPLVALACAACGGSETTAAPPSDGDASSVVEDTRLPDGEATLPDAAIDAAPDATPDATIDAPLDAPTDAPAPIEVWGDAVALDELGHPAPKFYAAADVPSKSGLYGLRYFQGRVYVGHGSTNAKVATKVVYFDVAADELRVEKKADGTELAIKEEVLDQFEVFDGDLYVNSRDPLSGGSRFIRKSGATGAWTVRENIAKDAHNYSIFKLGAAIMTNHGVADAPAPGVLMSFDDGVTWSIEPTPALAGSGTFCIYGEFFELGGSVFTTSVRNFAGKPTDNPWMIRFDGAATNRWSAAHQDPEDFFGTKMPATVTIGDAAPVSGAVTFRADGGLWVATSIVPPKVARASLPDLASATLGPSASRDGVAYWVFQRSRADGDHDTTFVATADGETWTTVATFVTGARFSHVERAPDAFYLTGSSSKGSGLYRVRRK